VPIVLVVCPKCGGTNNAPDSAYECGSCNRGHVAIDNLPNSAGVLTHPDGTPAVPWIDTPFPEVTR
jgi:hypothetical protein